MGAVGASAVTPQINTYVLKTVARAPRKQPQRVTSGQALGGQSAARLCHHDRARAPQQGEQPEAVDGTGTLSSGGPELWCPDNPRPGAAGTDLFSSEPGVLRGLCLPGGPSGLK